MVRCPVTVVLCLIPASSFAQPCELYNDSGESLIVVRDKHNHPLPPYSRLVLPAATIEIVKPTHGERIGAVESCGSKFAILDDLKIIDLPTWFSAELRGTSVVVRAPKGARVVVEDHEVTVGAQGQATIAVDAKALASTNACKANGMVLVHIEVRVGDDTETVRLGLQTGCDPTHKH